MAGDEIDPEDPGVLELAKRLEAYADARLDPSVAGTTRMRTSVMTAAHRRAALVAADGLIDAPGVTTTAPAAEKAHAAGNTWRRPVVAVMAGFLTLAMLVGMAYSTKPGGPLYAARLWTEMANLPAEVVARAEAEIHRLDARIQEAQEASTVGDGPAARAALSAYSVIVIEAARGSGGDPAASAVIEISVTRHIVVLTLMVDSVPPPARDAVQEALSSGTMVLNDLDGAGEQDSRERPIGADRSKATRPAGARRVHPTQVGEPAPAREVATGEQVVDLSKHARSDKTVTDAKEVNVRRHDARSAGKGAIGGAGPADPAVRSKAGPDGPDCDPIDPPDAGGT
jgi:hypothetical protein